MMHHSSLGLLALFTAACAYAPYPAYSIGQDQEHVASVVVEDAMLQSVIRVGVPDVQRLATGELQVMVPVRNVDDEQIQVLAQVSFRDELHRAVGDDSNRQLAVLGVGATKELRWTSRNREASDFVVRLSWNR